LSKIIKIGLPPLGINELYILLFYFVLLKNCKANFDVAYRVLHPKCRLNLEL